MFSGGLSEEICLPFLAMAEINLPIPSNEAEPHRHTLESLSNNNGDNYVNIRSLKSEFALLQTLSHFFYLVRTVKCW